MTQIQAYLAALRLGWRSARLANIATVVLAVVSGALPAVTAWLGKLLVDELAVHPTPGRVTWLAAMSAAVGVVGLVVGQLTSFAATVIRQSVTVTVTSRLFDRINHIRGFAPFEDPVFQDRIRLAQQAGASAPSEALEFLWSMARAVTTAVGLVGLLVVVWWPAAVLLMAGAGPAVLANRALARRRIRLAETTAGDQRRAGFLQYLLTEARTVKEIRLFGLGWLLLNRMTGALRATTAAQLRLERRTVATESTLAVAGTVVTGLVAVIVVRAVVAGHLTIGDFTMFSAAVLGLQSTLNGVAQTMGNTQSVVGLFGHYQALLAITDDLPDGDQPVPALREAIELRDVWFRYGDGPWVLRGVNLRLPAAQVVGLIGANGAGKSTLVKLLCRGYDPARGSICWDGIDIRTFRVAELRARITATFQDFCRYDMTAAENIGVGDLTRWDDRAAIASAARRAGIHDTVVALPQGYDTMLSAMFAGPDSHAGVTLSGGQQQRLAVARAMMRIDASLAILDEPTSGLDPEAEQRLHATLTETVTAGVRLLISHRLGALRNADLIVVMAEGQVTESGNHDELMEADGQYRRLFSAQATNYQDARVVTV